MEKTIDPSAPSAPDAAPTSVAAAPAIAPPAATAAPVTTAPAAIVPTADAKQADTTPPVAAATTHLNPYARLARNAAASGMASAATASQLAEQYKSASAENAALKQTVASFAATELAALPSDAHRAAVAEAAGADPQAQLRVIAALKKHGVVTGALPLPAGATTAPPIAAPAAGDSNDADVAVFRAYEDARTKGLSRIAAQLSNSNAAAIERGRQKTAVRN